MSNLWQDIAYSMQSYPLLYALLAAILAFWLGAALWQLRRYRRGQPLARSDQPGRRLWGALQASLLHTRMLRRARGGIMHLLLFCSFFLLLGGHVRQPARRQGLSRNLYTYLSGRCAVQLAGQSVFWEIARDQRARRDARV